MMAAITGSAIPTSDNATVPKRKQLLSMFSTEFMWERFRHAKKLIATGRSNSTVSQHSPATTTKSAPATTCVLASTQAPHFDHIKWPIPDDANYDDENDVIVDPEMCNTRKFAIDANEEKETIAVIARASHLNSALKSVGLL